MMLDKRTALHRASVSALNGLARTPRAARALFAMIGFHPYWGDHLSEEARFLAFCASLKHLAYGQILQDLWVLYELDLHQGGYFVEFGAHDGRTHSNTKLLEDRFGWTGILAEPNPDLSEVLRAERRATVDTRCVWDSSGGHVALLLTEDSELSTVAGHAERDLHTAARAATAVREVAVPTVSLDDLLDDHAAPASLDFLSVDTEGTELRVLEAFSFERHRPRLVAVEHNGRADQEQGLDALMADRGYERRFRTMSDWDAWYRLAA